MTAPFPQPTGEPIAATAIEGLDMVLPRPADQPPLARIADRLDELAAGLDMRFVAAGNALGLEYQMVEQLIAVLEGMTSAMNGSGGQLAIARLLDVARSLTQLPTLQRSRNAELDGIGRSGRSLIGVLDDVRKTLDLLRVYGLNVQVVAADTGGFTDFANQMTNKIEHSDSHVAALGEALKAMNAALPAARQAEQNLVAEFVKVLPMVPERLIREAGALRDYQADLAVQADRIATAARTVRGHVAEAIGALQVGDIARQRLEHLAAAARLVSELPAGEDALLVQRRMAMLLAAQITDTTDQFQGETDRLVGSLRRILPQAKQLLDMSRTVAATGPAEGGAEGGGQTFLHRLKNGIAEMATLTGRLREADLQVDRIAAATSEAADGMVCRLAQMRRARRDVQLMALNAGFRSMRAGVNSRPLTIVTAHIHDCANVLDRQVDQIDTLIGTLSAGASRLGELRRQAGSDAGEALSAALRTIDEGAAHIDTELAKVGEDAAQSLSVLEETIERVDCNDAMRAPLWRLAGELTQIAEQGEDMELPPEAARLHASMLDRLVASYTMAREREIHAAVTGQPIAAATVASAGDDTDDDLFDDALF
jgi:ribosomal protein L30/L7E